mmetsp:Transcript_7482/g.16177  ORF Transcript_7482/g.16177 Transcript_7482/m.16177 type:complete len:81 (-) Transcript_7482:2188-2430(-)
MHHANDSYNHASDTHLVVVRIHITSTVCLGIFISLAATIILFAHSSVTTPTAANINNKGSSYITVTAQPGIDKIKFGSRR